MIDFSLIYHSLPALLKGAFLSIQIAFFSSFLGIILGTLLGIGETSSKKSIRFLIRLYVTFFRGTPMLVQILFVYYVLPEFGLTISSFWAASIAIGLNSAAYMSQVIYAGIEAVPKGQIEAAYTLGFGTIALTRHIVLPQAFKIALPALGNELITLVKDSSLASIIGVVELSKEASIIRSRTYDAFSILLVVSFLYLMLTTTIASFIKKLEKRLNNHA